MYLRVLGLIIMSCNRQYSYLKWAYFAVWWGFFVRRQYNLRVVPLPFFAQSSSSSSSRTDSRRWPISAAYLVSDAATGRVPLQAWRQRLVAVAPVVTRSCFFTACHYVLFPHAGRVCACACSWAVHWRFSWGRFYLLTVFTVHNSC